VAELVGCLAMSHAPQLMLPPEQWHLLNNRSGESLPERPELQSITLEQKREQWNACMAAIDRLRGGLAELRPDTVVIVGDDQHENFVDDGMPPFTVYMGDEVEGSVSLRYTKQSFTDNRTRYRVDVPLALHLVENLMETGFDPAYCKQTRYEGGIGHAFARPFKFLVPDANVAVVPVMMNTYYPPVPSAKRCIQFGQALAEVIQCFPEPRRVALVASGGLSHTKIREDLDASFLRALGDGDLGYMAAMSPADLVEGTSEIRNWIVVAAAAAGRKFELLHYAPLYRTVTGVGCAMGFARWQ
jgi:aromatic ring-opening dioxygenase catalytic subunit (LigB family)